MATTNKASPPKPWERAGAGAGASSLTGSSNPSTTAAANPLNNSTSSTAANPSSAPALPDRPASMTSSGATGTAASSTVANSSVANRYGSSTPSYGSYGSYGGAYGQSSYSSPYSRFGGYGGGGFGGYGGYGGYGGLNSGYGSYGSPYGGFGGPGGPADMSLTRQMEAGTAATFQLLQSVVSAFGGFAQMLESTYMATHSSFFAMIGVAEQFANLRNWLGEVLSVFTLLRFVKRMLGWGNGAEQGGAAAAAGAGPANAISPADFKDFSATGRTTPIPGVNGSSGGLPAKPKASKKPIVIFFLTVVGLPWLMNKLVKLITAKQEAEARRLGLPEGAIPPILDHNGQPLPQHLQPPGVDLALLNAPHLAQQQQIAAQEAAIDPATLTFVRAQFAHTSNDEFELSFNKDDIIAVLTPKEERTQPGWWRGRLRDGRIGWFPSTHVQEIPMNNVQQKLEQQESGKAVKAV